MEEGKLKTKVRGKNYFVFLLLDCSFDYFCSAPHELIPGVQILDKP